MVGEVRLKPLPPAEAIAFFEAKGFRISWDHRDMLGEEHAANFTVAKAATLDILSTIKADLDKVLAEGMTFRTWQAGLEPKLRDLGWWGQQLAINPDTGREELVQLGSPRRLRTIYDTNISMAMAAGKWSRIERLAAARPYLRYVAVMDKRTRDDHRQWHGTILPWDHPWWQTHYPPCGWGCRCTVMQLSERDLQRRGWKVSPKPSEETRLWINGRTGERHQVPVGIDPGFDYNVGTAGRRVAALRSFLSKVGGSNAELGAAIAAQVRPGAEPLFQRDFARWFDAIDPARPRGERRIIGALSPSVVADAAARNITLPNAAITVSDAEIAHMLRDAKAKPKDNKPTRALDRASVRDMPAILAAPQAVLFDRDDPAYLYVFQPGYDTRQGKLVVRVAFRTKVDRVSTLINAVRTGGLIDTDGLQRDRYELVEGGL